MSQPFKLFRLQQIDSQLDWMQARVREIEVELITDEALQQATEHAEEASRNLKDARQKLRQAEDDVRQQRLKIEQTESTLYGGKVRNPKELQDLQNETAALKRYLTVLEDRQLEAMLGEEEAASSSQLTKSELDHAQAQHDQHCGELMVEKGKLERDISRFDEERQAAASTIPDADRQLYDQLRQKRRGVAVSKVTDRACSACGSTLNSVLLQAAHSPNQLTRCDTCGRILYIG